MDILKVIFLTFLGLFSLGEVFRFDLGNNFVIKPLDIVAIMMVALWLLNVIRSKNKKFFEDSLSVPIVLFIVSMLISLALNIKNYPANEIVVAFSYIARWILYASLYFIVKGFSPKFKQVIMHALLLVGGILIFFGINQYFLYPNLRNLSYLGWDVHMVRLFSTFLDPNFASAFFSLYLVYCLGIFMHSIKNNKVKRSWLIGLISIVTILSTFLTYSRGGLIMILTCITTFLLLIKKIRWILVFVLALSIFVLVSSKNFSTENINLLRTGSTKARVDSVKVSIDIIRENLLFGVGFNTYRYAQIKYGFRIPINSILSHADAGTDNSFLFIFATTGIVGLIVYLNLIFSILKKSYLSFRSHADNNIQKYIGIIAIATMGGTIVDSLFINSLFYSFVMIWVWILLGLIESS